MSLIYATENNDADKVKKLLATNKISVYETDSYGSTPLMYASFYGYEDIIELLLNYDNSSEHINRQNYGGATALMYASCDGHKEIVELLLEHDANPNILNKKDKLAIDVAKTDEIKELLLNWEPKGVKKAKAA